LIDLLQIMMICVMVKKLFHQSKTDSVREPRAPQQLLQNDHEKRWSPAFKTAISSRAK